MSFKRRSAYYSRNDSYSRSLRAELAEGDGKFPITRAAAHLGVSVKAFKAGCDAMGYRTSEWHHVGKYANMVDYWDTNECRSSVEFWRGAAAAYASKKKQAELIAIADAVWLEQKEERIAEFKAKLERQRDCSKFVLRHHGCNNWCKFAAKKCGGEYTDLFRKIRIWQIPNGDMTALAFAIDAAQTALEQSAYAQWERCETHRIRTMEDQMRKTWLESRLGEITPVVPENRGGCTFKLLSDVSLIATATGNYFTPKLRDAMKIAVEFGFNAVTPANPTLHKYGNGWLPCIIA